MTTYLSPLEVVKFEVTPDRISAILIADPADSDAFAYPNATDPDSFWARRADLRCEEIA